MTIGSPPRLMMMHKPPPDVKYYALGKIRKFDIMQFFTLL